MHMQNNATNNMAGEGMDKVITTNPHSNTATATNACRSTHTAEKSHGDITTGWEAPAPPSDKGSMV
jgi:hypothetical protein